jgi:uncharacterized membrane protein YgcG
MEADVNSAAVRRRKSKGFQVEGVYMMGIRRFLRLYGTWPLFDFKLLLPVAWVFAVLSFYAPLHSMVRAGVEVDNDDEGPYYYCYDGADCWDGPGFYYGIWFDNEDDFHNWRNGHYYYNNGYYYGNGHHHGDGNHHGGGGPGGGHGGGGHGGGGHH